MNKKLAAAAASMAVVGLAACSASPQTEADRAAQAEWDAMSEEDQHLACLLVDGESARQQLTMYEEQYAPLEEINGEPMMDDEVMANMRMIARNC